MGKGLTYRLLASLRVAVLASAVLAGISACGKIDGQSPVDDSWGELGGDRPVRFSSSLAGIQDAATKSTTSLPDNTVFGVFAFYQPGTPGNPGAWASGSWTPNFMFNQPVLFRLLDTYTYSPLRYWPHNTENTITFWAYSPYSSTPTLYEAGTETSYTSTSTGLPDVGFTVTNGRTDLLLSDLITDQSKPAADQTVNFTFRHFLSLIDVNIKKDDPESKYTVTLKSLRFDGIHMTAVHRSAGWADWSGVRENFAIYSGNGEELSSGYTTFSGMMLMPQVFNDPAARMHIEFSVWREGMLHERTTVRNILLSRVFENASAQWAEDTHYTLDITVSPDDPIEFTVSWSDWGDVYNYHITG